MGTLPLHHTSVLLGLCAVVLLMLTVSNAATQTEKVATVVGTTECLDCAQKSIKNEHAVKGLRVAIKCKVSNKKYETKATGELDSKGDFKVKLPGELLQDNGELKQECFAQLRGTSNEPCPAGKNGLSPNSKLVLKSKEKEKHTFTAAAGKLLFSSATCVSATFWRPYGYPWHKTFPKYPLPPFKFPPKPYYYPQPHPSYKPPAPLYKPPSGGYYQRPAPVYKPRTPVYKPPSSGGYYQPPAPVYKPPSGVYYKPPAASVYKPPTGGYYNPPAGPVYKPTPVPYYKHPYHPIPIYKKPLLPFPQLPPFHHPHPKLSFPPIFKKPLPPFPGWPPFSRWHKYSKHPGFPPAKVHRKKL